MWKRKIYQNRVKQMCLASHQFYKGRILTAGIFLAVSLFAGSCNIKPPDTQITLHNKDNKDNGIDLLTKNTISKDAIKGLELIISTTLATANVQFDEPVIKIDKIEFNIARLPDDKYREIKETKYDHKGNIVYERFEIEKPITNKPKEKGIIDNLLDKFLVGMPSWLILIAGIIYLIYRIVNKMKEKKK